MEKKISHFSPLNGFFIVAIVSFFLLMSIAPLVLGQEYKVTPETTYFTCVPDVKTGGQICAFPSKEILEATEGDTKTIRELLNKTKIIMFPHGTKYKPGAPASPWLQLVDTETGEPINNATCYFDIINPIGANLTRFLVDNQVAPYLSETDGVYRFNLIAPSTEGVYPVTANCIIPTQNIQYYPSASEGGTDKPLEQTASTVGDITGESLFLNDFEDWIYVKHASSGGAGKNANVTYEFNNITNTSDIIDINLVWAGESTKDGIELNFRMYNWTGSRFSSIGPAKVLAQTTLPSDDLPSGIDEFVSFNINFDEFIHPNGTALVRMHASSAQSFTLFHNWLQLRTTENVTQIVNVMGSSEMNIVDEALAFSPSDIFKSQLLINDIGFDMKDSFCEDSQTIVHVFNNTVDGVPIPVQVREICEYGCQTLKNTIANTTFEAGQCVPEPTTRIGIIITVIVGIVILLALMRRN